MTAFSAFPPPDPTPPSGPEASEATRYLCAAGHLNEKFARAVVDEVVHQPHRAVAPSHEIGLGPIIRHCLAAQRRSLARDGVVTAVLLFGVVIAFANSLPLGAAVLLALVSLWLFVRGIQLVAANQIGRGLVAIVAAFVLSGPALGLFVLATSGGLGSGLTGLSPFGPSYDEYGYPIEAPSRWWLWWLLFLAGFLVIWMTYFIYRLTVHRTIAVELAHDAYDPRRAPAIDRAHQQRLDYIEQAERGNVSVFSQRTGARPFVGYGDVTETWALASELLPVGSASATDPSEGDGDRTVLRSVSGQEAVPFTIDELYDAIRTGIVELADPRLHPDDAIPHLTVRDRVFIAGRLPVSSPYLEQGRPRFRLSGPEIKYFERAERGRSRHYQCVRMAAWAGEVEVTTFLHATIRGRMLFVEFVATVMPGILAAYHEIDTYERLDAGTVLRSLGRSLVDVVRAPIAPVAVLAAAGSRIRRAFQESAEDHHISRHLMFDYGCRRSVREMGTDFGNPQLFQMLDADERIHVVEKRLLYVLVKFFRERGYNVADLVNQVTTVINNTTNSNTFNNSTLNSSPVAAGNSAWAHARTAGFGPSPAASARPAQASPR